MRKQFGRTGLVVAIALFVLLGMGGCLKDDDDRDDLIVPTDSPTGVTDPPAGALVSESLTNGQTVGTVVSATFTEEGLLLQNGSGCIEYSVPTMTSGYVEFSARGFVQDELHGGSEFKSALFTMWDGNAPYFYEQASYFYELRKFGHIDGRPDASNALDLRLTSRASAGDWQHGQRVVLSWDPSHTYRFRIEWGPGSTTVYRDGAAITSATVAPAFAPSNHMIGIGANLRSVVSTRRREAPHDIVISDVVIGTL